MNFYVRTLTLCVGVFFTVGFANSASNMDVQVQASIQSSMHMKWKILKEKDTDYQNVRKKLVVKDGWRVLPYGLYAELRTNDRNRIVSLRLGDFYTNENNVISKEQVYVSVNAKNLYKASHDVPLLTTGDHSQLQMYSMLFMIKILPGHRSGQYRSNVQFITKNLP
jgi:hypothetical protein